MHSPFKKLANLLSLTFRAISSTIRRKN